MGEKAVCILVIASASALQGRKRILSSAKTLKKIKPVPLAFVLPFRSTVLILLI